MKCFLIFLILLGVLSFGDASNDRDDDGEEKSNEKQNGPTLCESQIGVAKSGETVSWRETSTKGLAYSDPLCLDEEKFPLGRECDLSGWLPLGDVPVCASIQNKVLTCPPGFERVNRAKQDDDESSEDIFCVLLTKSKKWENACLQYGSKQNVLELDDDLMKSLLLHLKKQNHTKVWLPAKRADHYSPVVWWLPNIWGTPVGLDDLDSIQFTTSGDCLALDTTRGKFNGIMEPCSRNYPILCLYQDEPLLQLACPKNSYTSRYLGYQDTCFSINKLNAHVRTDESPNAGGGDISTICPDRFFGAYSAEKTYLYRNLLQLRESDLCAVAIVPAVDYSARFSREEWNATRDQITYTNWHRGVNLTQEISVADTEGAWHLMSKAVCGACEETIDVIEPEISLKFDGENLVLTILSGDYLWRSSDDDDEPGVYCFTNADTELITSVDIDDRIWTGWISLPVYPEPSDYPRSVRKDIYQLKMYGKGPGSYWCEGHAVPDFKFIQSQKIVAYNQMEGDVFAALLDLNCGIRCHLIYQRAYVNEVTNVLAGQIQSLFTESYEISVRAIKIESVDTLNEKIRMLFHISLERNDDGNDSSDEKNDEEDELELDDDIRSLYDLYGLLSAKLTSLSSFRNFTFVSMNHTQYCLPETLIMDPASNVHWTSGLLRERTVPKELCLKPNGLPVSRQCLGDSEYGAMWEAQQQATCDPKTISYLTQQLYQLNRLRLNETNSNEIVRNITELLALALNSGLIPADLFYLSRLLSNVATANINHTTLDVAIKSTNLTTILDQIMSINETIIRTSQTLNTTNQLLASYDNIINRISYDANLNNNSLLTDGTMTVITPKLILYTTDPAIKNISGVALYKNLTRFEVNGAATGDFQDYYLRPLYKNQANDLLLNEVGLEAAAYVPEDVISKMMEINRTSSVTNATIVRPPLRIIISLHLTGILFQENRNVTNQKSGGVVLSVSIPGYESNLPGFLPIFFKPQNFSAINDTSNICGYWDFSAQPNSLNGGWAKDGCQFVASSDDVDPVVLCSCTHLTHFALLVQGTYIHDMSMDSEFVVVTETHEDVLDLITLIGCSLSLIGIIGIVITALIFRSWREKASVKVLLQFSAAIALQMVLMCLVSSGTVNINTSNGQTWNSCIIFGALLQYSVLAVFSWMLITAYLQFIRYVRVLGNNRPSRFFLKSFIVGWCLPLVPVLLVVFIAPESFIPPVINASSNVCYPSSYALYFGVLLPIGIIVIANLVIFFLVLYNIFKGPTEGKLRTKIERDLILSQLRLSVFLFFLLGLSWIFGLAAASKTGIIFSYLFCLTATIQGFVLFIYFVIMDPNTRKLWFDTFSKMCGTKSKKIYD